MSNTGFHKHLYEDEDLYLIEKSPSTSNQAQEPPAEYKLSDTESSEEKVIKEITDEKPQSQPLVFKGDNLKSVAIVVNYPNEEFINSGDEAFLLKILAAVQLTAKDVAIINHHKFNNLGAKDLKSINANTCLVFGVEELINGKSKYSNQNQEGVNTLYCSDLGSIQTNVEEKKMLWSALQKVFLS